MSTDFDLCGLLRLAQVSRSSLGGCVAMIRKMEAHRNAAGHGGEDRMGFDALREVARHTYGADAAGYQEGRPDYPPRVYEVLRSRCGIGPGSRVLEIGPGSGLVTGHLVAAGATVVAVEPDHGFAEYLGQTIPEVQVVAAPFEKADVGGGFDAVVAATSFHWLDQSAALRKVSAALRPGGWAAIWWTVFSDPYRKERWSASSESA
jgi:SAM-dependent methyltransferase